MLYDFLHENNVLTTMMYEEGFTAEDMEKAYDEMLDFLDKNMKESDPNGDNFESRILQLIDNRKDAWNNIIDVLYDEPETLKIPHQTIPTITDEDFNDHCFSLQDTANFKVIRNKIFKVYTELKQSDVDDIKQFIEIAPFITQCRLKSIEQKFNESNIITDNLRSIRKHAFSYMFNHIIGTELNDGEKFQSSLYEHLQLKDLGEQIKSTGNGSRMSFIYSIYKFMIKRIVDNYEEFTGFAVGRDEPLPLYEYDEAEEGEEVLSRFKESVATSREPKAVEIKESLRAEGLGSGLTGGLSSGPASGGGSLRGGGSARARRSMRGGWSVKGSMTKEQLDEDIFMAIQLQNAYSDAMAEKTVDELPPEFHVDIFGERYTPRDIENAEKKLNDLLEMQRKFESTGVMPTAEAGRTTTTASRRSSSKKSMPSFGADYNHTLSNKYQKNSNTTRVHNNNNRTNSTSRRTTPTSNQHRNTLPVSTHRVTQPLKSIRKR